MSEKTVLKLAKVQDSDVKGKNILMRVDYNVPISGGVVSDDTRIRASLKTIEFLLESGCRIVLMSHLGRPKGTINPKYSLEPVAKYLANMVKAKVTFAKDCVGPETDQVVSAADKGEIVLLENLRFHPEEEKNDEDFAKKLSSYGEFFVQEAFGALHRAHASTAQIPRFLPGAIGYLVQKELEFLDRTIIGPQRPFFAVIGGAKVSDKINVLNSLLEKVDGMLIGGAMAYTFLAAQHTNIGNSKIEEDKIEEARKIILKAFKNNVEFMLPADHLVVKDIELGTPKEFTQSMAIGDGWIGVDIGPRTEAIFLEKIKLAKTIFWNGPMGIFEREEYAHGTLLLANALKEATHLGAKTILGGGDTLSAIKKADIPQEAFSHCSTGGGASLEFIEGKMLPGLVALSKG